MVATSKEWVALKISDAKLSSTPPSFSSTLFHFPSIQYFLFRGRRALVSQAFMAAILWLEYWIFATELEIPFISTLIRLLSMLGVWSAFQWGAFESTRQRFAEHWKGGDRVQAKREIAEFLVAARCVAWIPVLLVTVLLGLDLFYFGRRWNFAHTLILGAGFRAAIMTWSRAALSTLAVIRRSWRSPYRQFVLELGSLGIAWLAYPILGDHAVGAYLILSGIAGGFLSYFALRQTLKLLRIPKLGRRRWIASFKFLEFRRLFQALVHGGFGVLVNFDSFLILFVSAYQPRLALLIHLTSPLVKWVGSVSRSLYPELQNLFRLRGSYFRPLRRNFWLNGLLSLSLVSLVSITGFFLFKHSLRGSVLLEFRLIVAALGVPAFLWMTHRKSSSGTIQLPLDRKLTHRAGPLEGAALVWSWAADYGTQTELNSQERRELEHSIYGAVLNWAHRGRRGRVRGYRVEFNFNSDQVLHRVAVALATQKEAPTHFR